MVMKSRKFADGTHKLDMIDKAVSPNLVRGKIKQYEIIEGAIKIVTERRLQDNICGVVEESIKR
jgi:hypothetical protein